MEKSYRHNEDFLPPQEKPLVARNVSYKVEELVKAAQAQEGFEQANDAADGVGAVQAGAANSVDRSLESLDFRSRLQAGEELLQAGRLEEAAAVFEAMLEKDCDFTDAWIDLGLVFALADNATDAVRCFEKALSLDSANQMAFFNMLDLLIQVDAVDLAAEAFRQYGPAIGDSTEMSSYAAAFAPIPLGDGSVSGIADVRPATPGRRLKIAFVCGPDQKFIQDIEARLAQHHDVKTCHFGQNVSLAPVQQAMDWADVTWFEWCDPIMVAASTRLKKTSRVVCRLHRYEAFMEWPKQVNWDFIDALVLVAPHMLDVLKRNVPDIEQRVYVQSIYNGIDLSKYTFREREPGFDLAYVGYVNHRKNPSLLLQCMHALVRRDSRYRLHIAGTHQEQDYRLYFDHMVDQLGLGAHVHVDGWMEDIASWLDDKQYVVSASIHEGHPCGVTEAMACGLKPLIHNFPGAETLYPRNLLYNSVDEFVQQVIEAPYESGSYRRFIEEHYSLDRQLDAIEGLLLHVGAVVPEPA